MIRINPLSLIIFLLSFCTLLYELLLTRIFSVVLFGPQAHLAVALALLGAGLGAMLLYVRPTLFNSINDTKLLENLIALFSISIFIILLLLTQLPLTYQSEIPPETFQERSSNVYAYVNTPLLSILLPILAVPFAVSSVIIAAIFRDVPALSGKLYGWDLVGGALASLFFYPLLRILPAPDALLLIIAIAFIASGIIAESKKFLWLLTTAVFTLGAFWYQLFGNELLPIRYAAGFAESTILSSKWTPITRISIFRSPKSGTESIVLDNGSASPIVTTKKEQTSMAKTAARALVYTVHSPGRVAIIGASAGPDVAVAQHYGFRDVVAIDIAGDIFSIVQDRSREVNAEYSPFFDSRVEFRDADGRAAILHDPKKFDIIQIVHANIWSLSGVLSNVWSPALLETREAFETYLDKLNDDGTISIAKGSDTIRMIPAVIEALKNRGIDDFSKHIVLAHANSTVLLIKKKPWTKEDLQKVEAFQQIGGQSIKYMLKPGSDPEPAVLDRIGFWPALNDDKPYSDTPIFWRELKNWILEGKNSRFPDQSLSEAPLAYTYSIFVVQMMIVGLFGCLVLFTPLFFYKLNDLRSTHAIKRQILFCACVGYGFIGIELTFMNRLVLLMNHPALLIAGTLFGVLLFAGLGSMYTQKIPHGSVGRSLITSQILVLISGVVCFFWLIPQLLIFVSSLPPSQRFFVMILFLAPTSFFMGMSMPLAMRLFAKQEKIVYAPWLWAVNCWASVFGSFLTVVISRFYGYTSALIVSFACYCIASCIVYTLFAHRR